MKEETDDTSKGFAVPGNSGSPDYLHLIFFFYRHPSQAFKIVNSGKTVHGVVFFAVFVYILSFLYCTIGLYFINLYWGYTSTSLLSVIPSGITGGLSTTIEFFLIFATEAVVLLGLLWIVRLEPPRTRTLNVIFYSCAIAYSVQWIFQIFLMISKYVLLGDVMDGISSNIYYCIYYIYLAPLAYLQYVGLKDLLKTKHFLILIAVVIAVVVHYLLFEPEMLFIRNVFHGIF